MISRSRIGAVLFEYFMYILAQAKIPVQIDLPGSKPQTSALQHLNHLFDSRVLYQKAPFCRLNDLTAHPGKSTVWVHLRENSAVDAMTHHVHGHDLGKGEGISAVINGD